jgi:hypothetical protein
MCIAPTTVDARLRVYRHHPALTNVVTQLASPSSRVAIEGARPCIRDGGVVVAVSGGVVVAPTPVQGTF